MAIKLGPSRSPAEVAGRGNVETRRFSVAAIGNMAHRAISRTISVFNKSNYSTPVANASLSTFLNHAAQRTRSQEMTDSTSIQGTEPVQAGLGQKSFSEASLAPIAAAQMEGHIGGSLSVFPSQTEPQIMPPIVKELIDKNKAGSASIGNKGSGHSTPEIQNTPITTPDIDDRKKYEDALASGDDAALSAVLGETVRPGYIDTLQKVTNEPTWADERAGKRALLEDLLKGLHAKWAEEPSSTEQEPAITAQNQSETTPVLSQAAIPGTGWFTEAPSGEIYEQMIDGLRRLSDEPVALESEESTRTTRQAVSSHALRLETLAAVEALENEDLPTMSNRIELGKVDEGELIFSTLKAAEQAGAGVFSRGKFAENTQVYLEGARAEVREYEETRDRTDALSLHLTQTTKSIDDFLKYDASKGGMDLDGIVEGTMATYATSLHARELIAEGIDSEAIQSQTDQLMNKLSDPEFFTKAMTIATAGEPQLDQLTQYYQLHQLSQVLRAHNPELMDNPVAKQAYYSVARRINALGKLKRQNELSLTDQ